MLSSLYANARKKIKGDNINPMIRTPAYPERRAHPPCRTGTGLRRLNNRAYWRAGLAVWVMSRVSILSMRSPRCSSIVLFLSFPLCPNDHGSSLRCCRCQSDNLEELRLSLLLSLLSPLDRSDSGFVLAFMEEFMRLVAFELRMNTLAWVSVHN